MSKSNRDWHWLLLIGLLLLVAMFGVYAWLQYSLSNLEQSVGEDATASSSVKAFTREEVTRYATELQQREARFNSLLNAPEKVVDPSL